MNDLAVKLFTGAYVALALALPLEMWWSHRRADGNYRSSEATSSLALALIFQMADILARSIPILAYAYVSSLMPSRLPLDRPWAWVVGFFVLDFGEYWVHRAMHRVNLLWAVHEVHHSGEDYNLATGPRQAFYAMLAALPLKLPLALIVPFPMFVVLEAGLLIYALFLHTRYLDHFGWLGHILNTPSHHRVHHARNPRYLDRNHGAVLILWDRVFGTFEREDLEELPLFGVTEPLASHGLVDAHLHHLRRLVRLSRATPRLVDKLRVWFAPPDWVPPGVDAQASASPDSPPLLDAAGHRLVDSRASAAVRAYTSVQLFLAVPALPILAMGSGLSVAVRVITVLLVIWTLHDLRALLALEPAARRRELVRVAATTALLVYWAGGALATPILVLGAASFAWVANLSLALAVAAPATDSAPSTAAWPAA